MDFNAANFFYISVGLAIWIAVIVLFWVANEIVLVIRSLKTVSSKVEKGILGLEAINHGIKLGIVTMIKNFLINLKKGGENNEITKRQTK